jgi:alkaline phosphatase D
MGITRRDFLYYTGPLTVLPLLPERCSANDDYVNDGSPFLHGVASGDPLAGAVILWTRVSGDASAPESFSVRWIVSRDPGLSEVVAHGTAGTDASADFTVKVDVSGLRPGRTYYYCFEALGHRSPIGRTRTLPVGGVARLRLAVASCSNHPYGYFNAYRAIAERADLDAVIHLGDYIYEYANGQYGDGAPLDRVPEPNHEIVSLADYRTRHAQYKTDPDLQEAHRQHPFIAVWDDHESANDAFRDGAANHQPLGEGEWETRKQAAIQAYFEWMPIRPQGRDSEARVYRSFAFGDLVDLIMLDTRLIGRDQQVAGGCDASAIDDPDRQLLGPEQEAWLVAELRASKRRRTRWRLLGQQIMFGQLLDVLNAPMTCVLNTDQWDGYGASRARVLEALRVHRVDNVVFLTGDIHSSWGNDIAANPFDPAAYDVATGRGSVAVELVTPAVTSPGIDDAAQAALLASVLRGTHPHVKFVELYHRGYLLVDVTPERIQAEWYHLATILERSSAQTLAAILSTANGQNHLVAGTQASAARTDAPPLAPHAPAATEA